MNEHDTNGEAQQAAAVLREALAKVPEGWGWQASITVAPHELDAKRREIRAAARTLGLRYRSHYDEGSQHLLVIDGRDMADAPERVRRLQEHIRFQQAREISERAWQRLTAAPPGNAGGN